MHTSIVIPVYNAENYIAQCLTSITEQTRNGFEVVCVDDGSTDSSAEIIQHFSNSDSRIKLLGLPWRFRTADVLVWLTLPRVVLDSRSGLRSAGGNPVQNDAGGYYRSLRYTQVYHV